MKTDLEWDIYYEMEELKEEAEHIFDLCKSIIRNSYWPVKKIFSDDRAEKKAVEKALWMTSHIGHLPESNYKTLLRRNLDFVFSGDHDWFGADDMPHTKDDMAELLCKLEFDGLLGGLEDTICYQCR